MSWLKLSRAALRILLSSRRRVASRRWNRPRIGSAVKPSGGRCRAIVSTSSSGWNSSHVAVHSVVGYVSSVVSMAHLLDAWGAGSMSDVETHGEPRAGTVAHMSELPRRPRIAEAEGHPVVHPLPFAARSPRTAHMHDFARQDTEDQQSQGGADQEGRKGGARGRGRRLRSDGRPQDDRHRGAHGHLRTGLGILRSDDALGRARVGQSQLRTGEGGHRIRRAETPEIGNDDETGWGRLGRRASRRARRTSRRAARRTTRTAPPTTRTARRTTRTAPPTTRTARRTTRAAPRTSRRAPRSRHWHLRGDGEYFEWRAAP